MKRKNYRNVWLAACFSKVETAAESIHVKFKGGQSADYTMDIFSLLASDPSVIEIVSNESGELYLYTDKAGERHTTGWN